MCIFPIWRNQLTRLVTELKEERSETPRSLKLFLRFSSSYLSLSCLGSLWGSSSLGK